MVTLEENEYFKKTGTSTLHPHLSEPLWARKNIFVRISEKFGYRKCIT